MSERRLVGIDLGITSRHTVAVLGGDSSTVCRRSCVATQASLTEIEQAALAGAEPGLQLEVVMEATGLLGSSGVLLRPARASGVPGQLSQVGSAA